MRCIDGNGDRANGGGCCLEGGLIVLLDVDEAHVCYAVAARLSARTTPLVLNNQIILMNNFKQKFIRQCTSLNKVKFNQSTSKCETEYTSAVRIARFGV